MDTNKYVYAVSTLKCLENKMLKKEDFSRLIESDSFETALNMLFDIGYFPQDTKNKDITELLDDKIADTFSLIKSFDIEYEQLFLLQNDFFNIKASVKCLFDFANVPDYLVKPCSDWTCKIYDALRENDFSNIPKDYIEIIKKAYSIMTKTQSGEEVEKYIDNEFYQKGLAISKNNEFFEKWFKLLKDLKSIDVDAENKKMEFLKNNKNNVFSIDPIFGYYFGILNEVRNLRLVLFSKRANIDKSTITERLGETYV